MVKSGLVHWPLAGLHHFLVQHRKRLCQCLLTIWYKDGHHPNHHALSKMVYLVPLVNFHPSNRTAACDQIFYFHGWDLTQRVQVAEMFAFYGERQSACQLEFHHQSTKRLHLRMVIREHYLGPSVCCWWNIPRTHRWGLSETLPQP